VLDATQKRLRDFLPEDRLALVHPAVAGVVADVAVAVSDARGGVVADVRAVVVGV
jgi:hypothetical protein